MKKIDELVGDEITVIMFDGMKIKGVLHHGESATDNPEALFDHVFYYLTNAAGSMVSNVLFRTEHIKSIIKE